MMLLYIVVQEQAAVIAELNTKLKSVEEDLEGANKRENIIYNCSCMHLLK